MRKVLSLILIALAMAAGLVHADENESETPQEGAPAPTTPVKPTIVAAASKKQMNYPVSFVNFDTFFLQT